MHQWMFFTVLFFICIGRIESVFPIKCLVSAPCKCTIDSMSLQEDERQNSIECSGKQLNLLQFPKINNVPTTFQKVNFSNNSLTSLPFELKRNLRETVSLDVSNNTIQSITDIVLGLNKLSILLANDNIIKKLENSPFRSLTQLTILSLSHNQIEAIRSDSFIGLRSLQYLYLDNCGIVSLAQNSFRYTLELNYLDLSNNQIAMIKPGSFRPLQNLVFLDLHSNKIDKIASYTFSGAPLETLELSDNMISSVGNGSFASMLNTLKNLHLGMNYIACLNATTFENLTSLEKLQLSDNKFRKIPSNFIIDSQNLKHIDFGGNAITEKSFAENYFQNFPELEFLMLTSTGFTTVPNIKGLNNLMALSLMDTTIKHLWPCQFEEQLNSNKDFNLWLYNAPLHCDCGLQWLSQWLSNGLLHEASVTNTNYSRWKCSSPWEVHDKLFDELTDEKLACDDNKMPQWCNTEDTDDSDKLILYIKNHTEDSITISWKLNIHTVEILEFARITWINTIEVRKNESFVQVPTNSQEYEITGLNSGSSYTICIQLFTVIQSIFHSLVNTCKHDIRTRPKALESSLETSLSSTNSAGSKSARSKISVILPTIFGLLILCGLAILAVFLVRRFRKVQTGGTTRVGDNIGTIHGQSNPGYELDKTENREKYQPDDSDFFSIGHDEDDTIV